MCTPYSLSYGLSHKYEVIQEHQILSFDVIYLFYVWLLKCWGFLSMDESVQERRAFNTLLDELKNKKWTYNLLWYVTSTMPSSLCDVLV